MSLSIDLLVAPLLIAPRAPPAEALPSDILSAFLLLIERWCNLFRRATPRAFPAPVPHPIFPAKFSRHAGSGLPGLLLVHIGHLVKATPAVATTNFDGILHYALPLAEPPALLLGLVSFDGEEAARFVKRNKIDDSGLGGSPAKFVGVDAGSEQGEGREFDRCRQHDEPQRRFCAVDGVF
ncbi:hypothetical protein ACHAWF_011291 [Thalassiosira exigua]